MRKIFLKALLISIVIISVSACKSINKKNQNQTKIGDTLQFNTNANGDLFEIIFEKGKAFNHPSFVFWIEDLEGNFIQTLFITKYASNGIFRYADAGNRTWVDTAGESIRPAALPYWAHKRNVISRDSIYMPTPENPVADTYSGATPKDNFVLIAKSDKTKKEKFRLLMEINQTWDWNEHWHNNLYPNNINYMSSCQPSLVYAVTIEPNSEKDYYLNPIGHGHYAGANGELFTDLTSFTTALNIVKKVNVKLKN
jgi:hypothetical protein